MPASYLFILSFALFSIGIIGFLTKKNLIIVLMFLELMLNAANIAFIGASKMTLSFDPRIYVLMVFAVAAAEAGVGLAIAVLLIRKTGYSDISLLKGLKG